MRLYRGPSAVPGSGCRARLARSTLRHGRCCILAAYLERKERALIDRVTVGGMFPLERPMALALCADVAARIHGSVSGVAQRRECFAL